MIPPYMQKNLKRHYENSQQDDKLAGQIASNERSQKARADKKDQETRVNKITYEQLTGRKPDGQ